MWVGVASDKDISLKAARERGLCLCLIDTLLPWQQASFVCVTVIVIEDRVYLGLQFQRDVFLSRQAAAGRAASWKRKPRAHISDFTHNEAEERTAPEAPSLP